LDATYDALMADRTIGVLGGRLLHADGTPIIGSVRRFPDIWSQLAIVCKLGRLFPRLLNRYLWDDFDFTRSQDVDQVRGSFFAFRRELLKTIGFLDAGYHLWFEEVDYCRRVRAAGLRVRYCADAIARDYIGKGFAQMGHLEKQRIFTASMLRYFRKWHPRWQWALLALARPLGLLAAAGADVWEWMRVGMQNAEVKMKNDPTRHSSLVPPVPGSPTLLLQRQPLPPAPLSFAPRADGSWLASPRPRQRLSTRGRTSNPKCCRTCTRGWPTRHTAPRRRKYRICWGAQPPVHQAPRRPRSAPQR
ncbi:MAG: glycosyltransferase, partial [bacterium]|nr:glycosyltransferase [bacterium]